MLIFRLAIPRIRRKRWEAIHRDVKHFYNTGNKLNFSLNDSMNNNDDTLGDFCLSSLVGEVIRSSPHNSASTDELCEKENKNSLIDSKAYRTTDYASQAVDVNRSKKKSQDQGGLRKNHRTACRRTADGQTKMDAAEYTTHCRVCRKRFAPDRCDMVASSKVFASEQRETSLRHVAS